MVDKEFKILFSGPMGAGKTTAISMVSDNPSISTEVENTDLATHTKKNTTVAMDFGQIVLPEGKISLYGTPGQERFSFMWELLSENALGVIVLLDGSRPQSKEDLLFFLQTYKNLNKNIPFIVGLGYHAKKQHHSVDELNLMCAEHDIIAPIFTVDVRKKEDVLLLINTLLSITEAQHS